MIDTFPQKTVLDSLSGVPFVIGIFPKNLLTNSSKFKDSILSKLQIDVKGWNKKCGKFWGFTRRMVISPLKQLIDTFPQKNVLDTLLGVPFVIGIFPKNLLTNSSKFEGSIFSKLQIDVKGWNKM